MKKKLRTWKMWGGYVSGKLCKRVLQDGGYPPHWQPAIFSNLSDARQQYDDVRPVEVRELPKAKRKG